MAFVPVGLWCFVDPGVEQRYPSARVVGGVARHDCQTVVKTRCGNDQVGLREGMTGLAAFLDEKTPLEHDVFGYRKHSLIEHGPHSDGQPVLELSTANRVADHLDAVADLGERHRADEKILQR